MGIITFGSDMYENNRIRLSEENECILLKGSYGIHE